MKAQNEALLSDHETRLGDVETLAEQRLDLTDFDSAYTEIIAALGDIDDNATAIAEHEDRIAYMEGLDYVIEHELVASDFDGVRCGGEPRPHRGQHHAHPDNTTLIATNTSSISDNASASPPRRDAGLDRGHLG